MLSRALILPLSLFLLLMLIGFILMALQVISEVIKNVLVLMDREDLSGLAAHEAPLRVE